MHHQVANVKGLEKFSLWQARAQFLYANYCSGERYDLILEYACKLEFDWSFGRNKIPKILSNYLSSSFFIKLKNSLISTAPNEPETGQDLLHSID